jgi:hypothetical protein
VPSTARTISLEVDSDKVELVRKLLGTKSLTGTIDAALDGILAANRLLLLDTLFDSDLLDLADDVVMASAWR